MSKELTIPASNDVNQFVAYMASLDRGNKSTSNHPRIIRLSGDTGKYVEKSYDAQEKKSIELPFEAPFEGVMILNRFFAQWKYNSTPKDIKIRTREFVAFQDEEVELLKIDYSKKEEERTEVMGRFDSYQMFKADNESIDKVTNKATHPFDLWCSSYIYIPALDAVVNYRFKGKTRSSLFDFFQAYSKKLDVQALVQVMVTFGSKSEKKPASASKEGGDEYYYGTFEPTRLATNEELVKVMHATRALSDWMRSFKEEKAATVLDEVDNEVQQATEGTIKIVRDDEISLDNIPF